VIEKTKHMNADIMIEKQSPMERKKNSLIKLQHARTISKPGKGKSNSALVKSPSKESRRNLDDKHFKDHQVNSSHEIMGGNIEHEEFRKRYNSLVPDEILSRIQKESVNRIVTSSIMILLEIPTIHKSSGGLDNRTKYRI
jgi:hypothetical protein